MPVPWARPCHRWLPHSSQAATVSRRPCSLHSSVLRSQEPGEAGPAYRFRSALCRQLHTAANKNPSARSPAACAKVSLAKAPGFLLLNNLSFCIFKQSCQSLKMSFPPGQCHRSEQHCLPQPAGRRQQQTLGTETGTPSKYFSSQLPLPLQQGHRTLPQKPASTPNLILDVPQPVLEGRGPRADSS